MNEDKYIPTKEARKQIGVTTQTLINWGNSSKIRVRLSPSGYRLYNLQDLYNITGRTIPAPQKRKICYCRVSTKSQLEDLERQKSFMQSKYPNHELVTDCGSGINWKRKGLQTILESTMRGEVQEVVVAHRDRLCRFAFELIEFIMVSNKAKLIVLDAENGKSREQELADDVLSIINIYTCRKNGTRRYNKDKKSENLSNTSTEENIETMDRNE
jgi:putative resolvase